ncbi:hypothetical protein [Flavobacterium sp.]|uniref:hypothetical protein n=1 Tax=Flavobacterium sp. TaxID=239 RepID=UPI0031E042E0
MKNVLLLFALFLLLSCNNDDDSNNNRLEGRWSLVKKTGGFGGPNAPEDITQKTVLEFSEKKVKTYAGATLINEKNYYIAIKKSILGGDRKMIVIDKGNSLTQEFYIDRSYEIKGKRLILVEECADCSTLEYERIK